MKNCRTFLIVVLLAALIAGCAKPIEVATLYEREQQSLESSYQELTMWSQNIVNLIAEQDRTLDNALGMMENQNPDDEQDLEQLIIQAKEQKDRISQYFFEGQQMQNALFTDIYHFMGKLDSGAGHCGKTPTYMNVSPPELVDPAVLPDLKQAYASSLEKGSNLLSSNRSYPCEQFLLEYEKLVRDVEVKVDSINLLMNSLAS